MASEFRRAIRPCLECGEWIKFRNSRDFEIRKFCSRNCANAYRYRHNDKTRECLNLGRSKEARQKAAVTVSERMALGLIPKPPTKKVTVVWKCKGCGTSITTNKGTGFCLECLKKDRRIEKVCKGCQKPFEVTKDFDRKYHPQFCSKKCLTQWRATHKERIQKLVCLICGREFERYLHPSKDKTKVFCSLKCRGVHTSLTKSGENASAYRGGKTPLSKRLRTSSRYYEWRDKVFARDSYRCVKCGDNSYLHAHHVKPFGKMLDEFIEWYKKMGHTKPPQLKQALHYELFWDVDNGVTLCTQCHQKEHPDINLTRGI